MTLDKWMVLLGGLAAIVWVLWYFLLAGRVRVTAAPDSSGVQESTVVVRGGYVPAEIVVTAGRAVRLLFDRQEDASCSEEVVFPDFNIRRFLPAHQITAVEFTPDAPGEHAFTCGMGMLHGKVVVR